MLQTLPFVLLGRIMRQYRTLARVPSIIERTDSFTCSKSSNNCSMTLNDIVLS